MEKSQSDAYSSNQDADDHGDFDFQERVNLKHQPKFGLQNFFQKDAQDQFKIALASELSQKQGSLIETNRMQSFS